jgi:uncharacterized protein with GYD domain
LTARSPKNSPASSERSTHPEGPYFRDSLELAINVGDGVKGLLKEGGSARRDAISKLVESVGGRMESFYCAFGDDDAYVVTELQDNISGAALSLVVNASGLAKTSATVLPTPEDLDAATKKAPQYRPPGQ